MELTGKRFGRLLVLSRAPKAGRQAKWNCICDCGKETTPFQFSLAAGKSQSCGCIAAEKAKLRWAEGCEMLRKTLSDNAANVLHRLSKHPAYAAYAGMKQRCQNPKNRWFQSYGGRGISVSASWCTFEAFWADMQNGWFPKAQLGRIDNDAGYSAANCRWETAKQQQNNKSNNVFIETPKGRLTLSQAAEAFGVDRGLLAYRVKAGWATENLFRKSQRS